MITNHQKSKLSWKFSKLKVRIARLMERKINTSCVILFYRRCFAVSQFEKHWLNIVNKKISKWQLFYDIITALSYYNVSLFFLVYFCLTYIFLFSAQCPTNSLWKTKKTLMTKQCYFYSPFSFTVRLSVSSFYLLQCLIALVGVWNPGPTMHLCKYIYFCTVILYSIIEQIWHLWVSLCDLIGWVNV